MLAYAFDTITAEQALNIRLGDTLTFNGGPGRTVSVVYQSYDPLQLTPEVPRVLVTYGSRTVVFSTDIVQLSRVGALVMADGSALYIGDTSDERVTGSAGDDGLYGGPGSDSISGGDGRDLLQGNSGHDSLVGGAGRDSIYGGQGNDTIVTDREGGADEAGDWAHGNLGADEIGGGAGGDTLLGGQGNDFIGGSGGDDYLSGDLGDDELHGGLGSDSLFGGAGDDILQGGFGLDMLSGGDGDDQLVAQGPEVAVLAGEAGNDTLTAAGADKEVLLGGSGGDRFEIVAKTDPAVRIDAEIQDWEMHDTLHFPEVTIFGASAILPLSYSEFVADSYALALAIANEHISASGAKWVAAQVGANVYVFADLGDPADGADSAVLLVGRTLADIGLDNFA
ncbi:calcium-binding protein [Phenylobacterium sp.]|uniref:calcium-binding protein n=1 Tax=Phenylobacterium sp. TaxID=1871053 RepID=UPI002ED98241